MDILINILLKICMDIKIVYPYELHWELEGVGGILVSQSNDTVSTQLHDEGVLLQEINSDPIVRSIALGSHSYSDGFKWRYIVCAR